MLKRIKVRGKLMLLLVTPLVAVIVFAFSGIVDRTESASFQGREARIAELAHSGSELSLAIQVERLRTIQADHLLLMGDENDAVAAEQARTNDALDRWLAAVGATRADLSDESVLEQIDLMTDRLPVNLTVDRSQQSSMSALTSFLAFSSRAIDEITTGLPNEAADLDLFRALVDQNRLQSVRSAYTDVTTVGADAILTNEIPIVSATLLEASQRRIEANIDEFLATADPTYTDALRGLRDVGVLPSPASAAANPVREVQGFIDDPSNGGLVAWLIQGEERIVGLNTITDQLLDDAQTAAEAETLAANDEARSFLILAGSVVVLALTMALVIGRSLTRPLIRLTRNAEQLSSEELPALVEAMRSAGRTETPVLTPIEAKGRDEVAQLAHAISEIQQVTIDVAEEQGELLRRGIADIFVNLARRNQSLLDRQIDFIDQLEAREENPDQLENLFRLDHLATRMRRNAESLLVLAGAEPARRRGRPVEIVDVMRVAMGEIEDFSRIRLSSVDRATVAGSVAVDLAHLMSELMENATQFSPPNVDVEVVGSQVTTGAFQLTLADQGIGMSNEQLANANETLAEPPIVGLDLSRSLGFTVVSRLAHRLGVSVQLTSGSEGGVTAVVTIPAEMIGTVEPDEGVGTPEPEPMLEEVEVDTAATEPSAFPNLITPPAVDDFAPPDPPPVVEPPAPMPASPFAEMPGVSTPAPPAPPAPAPPLPSRRADSDDLGALPVRTPAAARPSPDLTPEPETTADPGSDLFAAFGSATNAPEMPTDTDADIFAPLDPGPAAAESDLTPPPPPSPAPPAASDPAPLPTRDPAHVGAVPQKVTSAGLIRRTPRQVEIPAESRFGATAPEGANEEQRPTPTTNRSPEEVRQMLSRYRSGLRKGRGPKSGQSDPNPRS